MHRLLILCSLVVFISFSAYAENGGFGMGSTGPIHITMDNGTVLNDKNIFRGNVYVKRGDVEARSDVLEVYLKKSKEVEKLIFINNVRLNKGDMRAISDRAEFNMAEDTAVLTGSVKLWQGTNYLEGEIVTVNNKTGEAKVFGTKDKRVKIIFNPEEGK